MVFIIIVIITQIIVKVAYLFLVQFQPGGRDRKRLAFDTDRTCGDILDTRCRIVNENGFAVGYVKIEDIGYNGEGSDSQISISHR